MNQTLLALKQFVADEQHCAQQRVLEIWERPLGGKLQAGRTQMIQRIEKTAESTLLRAVLGAGESRYREGDIVCIHLGAPAALRIFNQLSLESDEGGCWLLRGYDAAREFQDYPGGACFAEIDNLDLSYYYEKALDDIASRGIGREHIIPLLEGRLTADEIYESDYDLAAERAARQGFNEQQVEAVAVAVGAKHLACIQGPPGTGKTRVLALAAQIMTERGERVFLSSHTHMAINNALNKIRERTPAVVKIGGKAGRKALDRRVSCFDKLADWTGRPLDGGFVAGATPFAACTARMEAYTFDTLIFDEASQVTLALALMAMRSAKKYVFVGDHKQLPPVVLSRSILNGPSHSVFTQMLQRAGQTSVALTTTYRMNAELTAWPSKTFYENRLQAAAENAARRFRTPRPVLRHADALSPDHSLVFIASRDAGSRAVNPGDARVVAQLCRTLLSAGVEPPQIGVVSPFRLQGRRVRAELQQALGLSAARRIVADTVERMQGQERDVIIYTAAATDKGFIARLAAFVFQPERLNVAVTRAMRKLIIIGPDAPLALNLTCATTARWARWYEQLLGCCRRVEQSGP